MRRSVIALALSTALIASGVAAVAANRSSDQEGMRGHFSLINMVHTTQYQGSEPGTQEPHPWDGTRQKGGPFVYAGIPCTGNAPVNNISTDLTTYNTRLPGSRSPASTRSHPFSFRVVKNNKGKLRLNGTIVFTVCQRRPGATATPDPVPDSAKEKIYVKWNAKFKRTSSEEVAWWGAFRIRGGTGMYEDLTGEGRIAGYFFCFAPEGCTTLGEFRDGQYTMAGTYADPTIIPVPPPTSSPSPTSSGSPSP